MIWDPQSRHLLQPYWGLFTKSRLVGEGWLWDLFGSFQVSGVMDVLCFFWPVIGGAMS